MIPLPPPNVTGVLHVGHGLGTTIQDCLIRWNRMLGKTVLYLPGFDHAGISTQSVVEKMLWVRNKQTRHDFSREDFVNIVWKWKEEYHQRITAQQKRLGASLDWSREAFTMDEARSRAVAENFVRLHEDGVIYRANRLVNWCTALSTTLSNLEVEQFEVSGRTLLSVPGYTEKVEVGVITTFAYEVEDTNDRIQVATTRPETMLGDTAVAVHPDDPRYVHFHGKYVRHPFLDRRIPIITDAELVDMSFGTGAVKVTPAHDLNDYKTGVKHGLQVINILNDDGTLNEMTGEWHGVKRYEARKTIVEKLKKIGLFVEVKDNRMIIPLCSKSKDIIEPLMKPQWWVAQKGMAIDAMQAVKRGDIKIIPKTSENDFFRWLADPQDWCISRQLWWGHRIPAYYVRIQGSQDDFSDNNRWVAGRNEAEANAKAKRKFPGEKYSLSQDEDVFDTWFSSGLWPFSTLGWPEETDDMKSFYPASLLETGWDILFFWVARMVMLGLKLTGSVPFKEVYCHSLVRDAHGRKMSKSLGNVIDPMDVITGISLESLHEKLLQGNLDPSEVEKAKRGQQRSFPDGIPECGTDALRFALCASMTGGRDINLDILRVEGYRKFCNKVYNATRFALMKFDPNFVPKQTSSTSGRESLVERWILQKLNTTAKDTNLALENRDFFGATNAIYSFWLYELCDVFIENSKYLLQEGSGAQKRSALDTLYTCLDAGLKLIHPFMPFVSEELWQRLPRRQGDETSSIVLASYPVYEKDMDDSVSEASFDLVFAVVKAARSLMSEYNLIGGAQRKFKLFSPSNVVFIVSANNHNEQILRDQTPSMKSLIKSCEILEIISKIPEGCAMKQVTTDCHVHLLIKVSWCHFALTNEGTCERRFRDKQSKQAPDKNRWQHF